MVAYRHKETGTIRHASEGSWQEDYLKDSSEWKRATNAEIAEASGVDIDPNSRVLVPNETDNADTNKSTKTSKSG